MSRLLDIVHFSVHGLIRGNDLELGRDADTGGQCLYVLELVRALARHPEVRRVTLVTRRVVDPRVATDYARPHEDLGRGAEIRRIDGGPKRYLRKEVLWRHLDGMIDNTLSWLRRERRVPDLIHAHYADAGYVGRQVAAVLGCPFLFTGHSLGRVKRAQLLESGTDAEEMEERYNLNVRIEAEELSLDAAAFVCTSTSQEIEEQYRLYDQYAAERMRVIPPGVDLSRFAGEGNEQAEALVAAKLGRFLRDAGRPPVLAIARADERKNLAGLVHAFGGNPWLREHANLVVVGGNRKTLDELPPGARRVWMELLRLMDDFDLHGICAIPKEHQAVEVPAFMRWAAERGGVFVNPAFTEPFGLTLLEASAAGLPIVATREGGPKDILANCQNGALVNPLDHEEIGRVLADILRDPEKQRELARQGARLVGEHYAWSTHVSRYLREVRAVLPEPARWSPMVQANGRLASSERLIVMDLPASLASEAPEVMERWRALFKDGRVGLGIATGLSYPEVRHLIEQFDLPRPVFVIAQLGGSIYYHQGSKGVPDEVWQRQVAEDWSRERVIGVLSGVAGLELQEEVHQHPLKVSYFREARRGPRRREVQRLLREQGVAAKVLLTADVFLDVLPVRSGKDVALRYLTHKWGIDAASIFYFATQGNDAAVMRGRNLAVVASGSDSQLAQLGARIRLRHCEKPGLEGLFEGLEFYGFLEGLPPPSPGEQVLPEHETVPVEELLP